MGPDSNEPERGGVHPVGEAIRSFLKHAGLDANLRDARIYQAWRDALSERMSAGTARRAAAVRFRDGELTIEVGSAALLQELSNFTGEGFRRRANELLGGEAIRRVSFKLNA